MTELERAQAEIELLREENRLLRQKLDYLIRQLHGAKSEKLDLDQFDLFGDLNGPGKSEASATHEREEAAEALIETAKPSRRKSVKDRKPRLPEDLPVEEVIIEPESVKACPEAWRRIGEEVSEELDYELGRFLCRRTVRPKYVHLAKLEAAPIVAELPEKLLERGMLASAQKSDGQSDPVCPGAMANACRLREQWSMVESKSTTTFVRMRFVPQQSGRKTGSSSPREMQVGGVP